MPASPEERVTPSNVGAIRHSEEMEGAAKLMARTSNPSIAFKAMVSVTAAICSPLIGAADSVSRTLLGLSFMVPAIAQLWVQTDRSGGVALDSGGV
jgi:hypothetical protein